MIQRVVVAGVLVKNKKALVIKRSKDESSYPLVWELPSGKLEIGEHPTKGIIREFKEEIGINVKVDRPLSITHFTFKKEPDLRHNVQVNYLVTSKSTKIKLSNEHEDYKWVTSNELKKLKTFKDIRDAVKLALSKK